MMKGCREEGVFESGFEGGRGVLQIDTGQLLWRKYKQNIQGNSGAKSTKQFQLAVCRGSPGHAFRYNVSHGKNERKACSSLLLQLENRVCTAQKLPDTPRQAQSFY